MTDRSSWAALAARLHRGVRAYVPCLLTFAGIGAIGAIGVSGKTLAHHSFAATYLEDQTITIEGPVLQFQFRNPHSFIHVRAPDENGEVHRWAVEWGSPSQLTGQGVGSATLRPGDVVRITGAPGRNASDHRMVMQHLIRPSDGYEYGDNPNETFD